LRRGQPSRIWRQKSFRFQLDEYFPTSQDLFFVFFCAARHLLASFIVACSSLDLPVLKTVPNLRKFVQLVHSLPQDELAIRRNFQSGMFQRVLKRVLVKLHEETVLELVDFLQFIAAQVRSAVEQQQLLVALGRVLELCFLCRFTFLLTSRDRNFLLEVEKAGSASLHKRALEQELRAVYQTSTLFVKRVSPGSQAVLLDVDAYLAWLYHSDISHALPGVQSTCLDCLSCVSLVIF
jgi:hypothetical protein